MIGYIGNKTLNSLSDSILSVKELVEKTKEYNYQSIVITDENFFGLFKNIQFAKTNKLKLIFGLDLIVNFREKKYYFSATVKDQTGYKNLLQLNKKKFNGEINFQDIVELKEGICFTLRNYKINYTKEILDNNGEVIDAVLAFREKLSDFFVCINNYEKDNLTNTKIMEDALLSKRLVFIPEYNVFYKNNDYRKTYEDICNLRGVKISEYDHYLISNQEFRELFSNRTFDNYNEFCKLHNFSGPKINNIQLPEVYINDKLATVDYLRSLSHIGLKKRLGSNNIKKNIYVDRLEKELNVIEKLGYVNYFLIVFDIVRFAKKNDINVGPGRGSSAGSLVCYVLGITEIDPIIYNTYFERFLNPERKSLPDIDLDFEDSRRNEVIEYAFKKYSIHNVVSIITFQKYTLNSALKDISKLMNIDSNRSKYLIEKIMNEEIDDLDKEMVELKNRSQSLVGLIKQTGTHPAGLIFSKNKLDNLLPMQEGQQGTYQSQIELKELENFGFIKIDFLGLRTLSIMSQIIKRINLKEQFNLSKISMQDTKTYNLLKSGDTWGIFQLESKGINKVVKRLKPEKFDDLVALIALYRPGPMKNIDEFVLRKNGKSFTHMHSELKSILDETYGIIVYQEQVLRIVQEFANYSLSEADIFRRAISKKDSKLLFEERKKFIDKAVKNNQDFSVAKHIYDIIIKFANYGFNKSHSVSYALLTYQMAFLKANYYNDFILTMLDFSIGDSKTTFDIMKIIKTKNMLIGTPDINLSSKKYTVLNGKIIPPLNIVKSINEELSNFLIENRSNKYVSFHDLKTKIFKKISEKKLKMLIYSGALDSLDLNKKSMVENISLKTIEYSKYVEDFSYSKFPEYTYIELQKFELESYGYNLKYDLKNYLEKYKLRKIADLTLSKKISIACISINKKEIYTKEKKLMAFLELYDGEKKIVAKVFPTIYSKIKDLDINKYPLKILLKLEKYKEKIDYIINDISILSSN